MYFIKYRTMAVASTAVIKIEATNGRLCVLYGAGNDTVLMQVPCKDNPMDVMDRLIARMTELEAACLGNTYNLPSGGNGFCELKVEKVNPQAFVIDMEEL